MSLGLSLGLEAPRDCLQAALVLVLARVVLFSFLVLRSAVLLLVLKSCLGRLPKVDLIILEGKNVRPYVRPSVRPSTKSFFDLNEIWYVGRDR